VLGTVCDKERPAPYDVPEHDQELQKQGGFIGFGVRSDEPDKLTW
jgi:hypothetical protein